MPAGNNVSGGHEGGFPLRDGASSGLRCCVVPLLPGKPLMATLVAGGGQSEAFSRLGDTVQDITEFYQWSMDIQVHVASAW
jgi:hypothetical protein